MSDMYFQSCSHSEFLQNAPISVSVWYWINSEFPRSSYSCRPPGSPSNSCQDEWRLSLTKTWTTPYQNIGLHCFHCKCWATCSDSQLLLRKLENLRQVLVIWDHHVVKLCLCVHRQHQFFRASRVRRFIPVSLFPRVCMLSVFLSPHLRIFDWILALVSPHRFPGAGLTASFFIGLPQIDWISQILRRVLPRTQRVVQHQIHGFRLRLHWRRFRHRWTFTGSRFLPLFDMVLCFLIGSERKLLKWLQEDIEKFVMLNKLRLALRRMCVCGYAVHIWQLINIWVAPFSVSVSRDEACWRFCLGVIARVVSCPEPVSWS